MASGALTRQLDSIEMPPESASVYLCASLRLADRGSRYAGGASYLSSNLIAVG
jgi:hypothetical protein